MEIIIHQIVSKNFGILFSDLEQPNIPERYHKFLLELIHINFNIIIKNPNEHNIKSILKSNLYKLPEALYCPSNFEPSLAIGFEIKWWSIKQLRAIKNDFDSYKDIPKYQQIWNKKISAQTKFLLEKYNLNPTVFFTSSSE